MDGWIDGWMEGGLLGDSPKIWEAFYGNPVFSSQKRISSRLCWRSGERSLVTSEVYGELGKLCFLSKKEFSGLQAYLLGKSRRV
jgi:hypothetical protein